MQKILNYEINGSILPKMVSQFGNGYFKIINVLYLVISLTN